MSALLRAGRELDALIAEKVMGWQWTRVERRGERPLRVLHDPSAEWPSPKQTHGDELIASDFNYTVAHYSTVFSDAWLVVEAINTRGFHAKLTTPFEPGQPYCAGFTPHGMTGWNGRPDFHAGADTLPEAICAAALMVAAAASGEPPR